MRALDVMLAATARRWRDSGIRLSSASGAAGPEGTGS